jgi:hypothetical protein
MKHLLVFLLIAMLFITAATAAQSCVAAPGAENLIVNGDLELGSGSDPECWTKVWGKIDPNCTQEPCPRYNDSAHLLEWVADPALQSGMVLKSQYTGGGKSDYFSWHTSWLINLEKDTWYEFSFSFATEGIEPSFNVNQEMTDDSHGAGVSLKLYNDKLENVSNVKDLPWFWIYGPAFAVWDPGAWVYRTYQPKSDPWRNVKKRFKTPDNIENPTAEVITYNLPKGAIYFDNFVLKKVPAGDEASFKKSGTLRFLKFKGEDFFPIAISAYPLASIGNSLPLNEIKNKGFNTVGSQWYTTNGAGLNADNLKNYIDSTGLALIVYLHGLLQKQGDSREFWVNDPAHSVTYTGAAGLRDDVKTWGGFDNLLFFMGEDEITCHPSRRTGNFLPDLKSFQTIKDYLNQYANGKLIKYNFCGKRSPYTGLPQDTIDYYFPITDVITYTQNLFRAYPTQNTMRELDRGGELTRWTIDSSEKAGSPKYVLAFGLGELDWSNWDGQNPNFYRPNVYVPFNLQRFQIWDQIINGATGAVFAIATTPELDGIDLLNQFDNYHWQQITALSQELSSLYPVLLEPQFYSEWTVSDDRIDAMMKKHNGKIYLLTASTHYEDLRNITISLDSKYNIAKITALNEVTNGDIDKPFDRDIPKSTANSFVDDFVGDNAGSPAAVATPGYAVHIYEIELSAQECVDTPTLMNQYIPQWKRGEISLLALMQKMKLWNKAGCPP